MKLDHIALQVDSPAEAAEWYSAKFGADILYSDNTWAVTQLENIKLAFVTKTQHPPHIAIEVDKFLDTCIVKEHRDGSTSTYIRDPWGNCIEYIKYPKRGGEMHENKRQSFWGRARRKLQYWRSRYVD